jgi:DNA primase large subunit
MQRAAARFTRNDLAKYPFLRETTEYVKELDLKVEDLATPDFSSVLQRAEERVEEAILYTLTGKKLRNAEIEILSFPAAILLVIATENSFIKKRYALAEAKQAHEEMRLESKEKIMAIAENFEWNLKANDRAEIPCEFSLSFVDYISNTTHLRDKKWKLVNRLLRGGNVYLTRNEATRLLSEEVRKHIEKRLDVKKPPNFPAAINEMADKIKKLAIEKIGEAEMEGLPRIMVQEAFPPCVDVLYQAFTSGRHLSHVGRFTLTSFLINVGMSPEKVIELFRNFSDFNERMTRYQVEHIAGEKGSRTRYVPPQCDTLKTHGVCPGPNELCQRVRHPLAYYRRKLKTSG